MDSLNQSQKLKRYLTQRISANTVILSFLFITLGIILSLLLLPVKAVNAQEPSVTPTPSATPDLELTGAGWLKRLPPGSDITTSAITAVDCNTMTSPVVGYEISKGQSANDITDFSNDLIANGFSIGTVNIGSGSIPACVDILIVQGLAQNLALSTAYTAAEGTLLKSWAAGGHSLMLSGDWGTFSAEIDPLFQAYGYGQQGPSAVTDVTDTDPVDTSNTWVIFQADNFTSHPFLSGINSIELLTSSWFSSSSNAVVATDADATPANQPVLAAFADGAGCVALVADSNWNTVMGSANGYFKQDNAKLARQMTQWLSSCSKLELTKGVNPNPVVAGQNITYTITVTNNPSVGVTNIRITDTVPANTSFVAATLPHSGPDANRIITWSLGNLSINATVAVTMAVQVDGALPNNSIISNTAWVTSNEGLSNTATVSVTVQAAAQPQATVTGLVWQDLNGDTSYNAGIESILPNVTVVITDNLATAQTLVTDTSGRYTTTVAAGSVTIDVDQTDPDLSGNTILTTANDPGTVSISAGSSGGVDFGFQPLATVTGLVWEDINGDALYNSGTEPLLPNITVVITDSLGSVHNLATDGSGRYNVAVLSGTVTIDVAQSDPDIPPNSTLTTANDPTMLTVAAGNFDGVNFGFQRPAIPMLNLAMQVSPAGPVKAGDTLAYTVAYSNSGALTATNVVITDFIPANTTYISGSVITTIGTIEFYTATTQVAAQANIVTGLLNLIQQLPADGTTHHLRFKVRVNDTLIPANTATIVNQATINSRETAPQSVSIANPITRPAAQPDSDNNNDNDDDVDDKNSGDDPAPAPAPTPGQPAVAEVEQPPLPVKFLPETGIGRLVAPGELSGWAQLLWFILAGVVALVLWKAL